MRKEFIVERQGRAFILYSGLLDMAHENGLTSIVTTLIQAPTEANNRVAIVQATVTMDNNKLFTGIGDAAPNNVAPAMQSCLLRMAETRAKSRALRDAVNIGVAAFEELGDSEAQDNAPYVETKRPAQRQTPRPAGPSAVNSGSAACSECNAPAGKPHGSKCSIGGAK